MKHIKEKMNQNHTYTQTKVIYQVHIKTSYQFKNRKKLEKNQIPNMNGYMMKVLNPLVAYIHKDWIQLRRCVNHIIKDIRTSKIFQISSINCYNILNKQKNLHSPKYV